VALTIERLPDGEVSPYLTDELRVGDRLELRGPIGGYFAWTVADGGPLFLVGGGSGVVPLMAMARHRARAGDHVPTRLLVSARTWPELIYRDELAGLAAADPSFQVVQTLTRSQPDGWTGYRRRIDRAMLEEVAWPPATRPLVYVCGPTPLVEAVAATLFDMGHAAERIKTERFGPTGG
jgi:ferredoxin-NADP reductase